MARAIGTAEGHEAAAVRRVTGDGPSALQLTRLNWALLAAAAVLIAMGYAALASGSPILSTVIAPVLLVGSYAVLIPLGLIV